MNALLTLLRALRTDFKRWQNRRRRAKQVVYTWDRWQHTRAVQATRRRLWQP